MKTVQNDSGASGYQPRPAAPPSAGRALSVLIAVCAVLWVWLMLPEWYLSGTGNRQGQQVLWKVMFYAFMASPLWSNYVVFRWATRPLWYAEAMQVEFVRGLVLMLCLAFHLLQALIGVFMVLVLS